MYTELLYKNKIKKGEINKSSICMAIRNKVDKYTVSKIAEAF